MRRSRRRLWRRSNGVFERLSMTTLNKQRCKKKTKTNNKLKERTFKNQTKKANLGNFCGFFLRNWVQMLRFPLKSLPDLPAFGWRLVRMLTQFLKSHWHWCFWQRFSKCKTLCKLCINRCYSATPVEGWLVRTMINPPRWADLEKLFECKKKCLEQVCKTFPIDF